MASLLVDLKIKRLEVEFGRRSRMSVPSPPVPVVLMTPPCN